MPLLIPALVTAQQARGAASTSVTGRYEAKWGKGAGCILKVHQLSDSLMRFQLECSRGAPAYNTGEALGTIRLAKREALYSTTEWGERCEIRFRFNADVVVVTQMGSDAACGFGYGVYSDGRYRLVARGIPVFDETP